MGCDNSVILSYTVKFCTLEPMSQANTYKIKLLAQEELIKKESVKLINQISQIDKPEIKQFIQRQNYQDNTLFYYYLGSDPLLKTFNQSIKYVPYNLPKLSTVILLSLDSAPDFPSQIIENVTKYLEENKIVNYVLNLNEEKEKLEEAKNPNITKDSLSLKDYSLNYDDESIREKEGEIVISEDVTNKTYIKIKSMFENEDGGNSRNDKNNNNNNILETSADNQKVRSNHSHIRSVKFFASKFNDIHIFEEIMHYLTTKEIKKFYFYENNTNSEFEGWDAIFEFFEHNYSLRYIDLHSSNLYDYHLSALSRSLTGKRIRYLNLSENFLTLEGIEIISNFLKYNKTLQRLNLCRNAQCQFKAQGVKLITEALIDNPNIEAIDFSYMNLTGCGEAIGDFITNNKSIQKIYLRNVQLNAVDFKNIFVPLKSNKVLKEIDVSMNDMGGDKSLQNIADAIKENNTLNSLKIDQININNDNYEIIFEAIEKNKTISSYSVSYNSKIKPIIMLNFFIKQKQVKHLEYEPFDKDNPEDKKKELTLEEKKMIEKFKKDRPDMEFIYK